MFEIEFDPATRILHVSAAGFWTLPVLAGFSASIVARGTAIRLRHGHFAILNDVRRFPVQSTDVAHGISALMGKTASITNGPVATVVAAPLNKMQAERVMKGDNSRVFLDWDEANAWLEERWVRRTAA